MNDWFDEIGVGCELPAGAARALLDAGFVVIPDFVATERLAQLADAYDLAVASAAAPDLHIGSSTTRVHDFVNRGADFDPLYVCPPPFSKRAITSSASPSSSVQCWRGHCGHIHRHSPSTWTLHPIRMGGRWLGSSSWWTTFAKIMGPPVSYRARIDCQPSPATP